MNEQLDNLIAALRDELQQYGEMFSLLEQQQQLIVAVGADKLLEAVARINDQTGVLLEARQQRTERQRALAAALQCPPEATFTELATHLPREYRLLVGALVEENNALILRIQQRARQNHLLLSRSLELMQSLVNSLVQSTHPTTYSAVGNVAAAPTAAPALCDALS